MKLNISHLQEGGRVFFSTIDAPPTTTVGGSDGSGESKAKSTADNLLSKELLNKIAENGLPVDVDRFFRNVAKFQQSLDSGRVDQRGLYALQAEANRVVQASRYLEEAQKRAAENKALDEVAIDQNGFIYTIDKQNKIKKVPFSKFEYGKERALSVRELITQRQWNPQAVGNTDIATSIEQSVGVEKINDFIFGILDKFGTATNKSEAYTDLASVVGRDLAKRPTDQQYEALKTVWGWAQQVGLDTIVKESQTTKSKDVQLAFQYILSSLPNNMRAQLEANYIVRGGEANEAGAKAVEMIQMAIIGNNSPTQEYEIDLDKSKTGDGSGGKSKTANLTFLELLTSSDSAKEDLEIINPNNTNHSLTLTGTNGGPLAGADNKAVTQDGPVLLSKGLDQGLMSLVDKNGVFVGDTKVDPSFLDNLVYQGDDVMAVDAPVDASGNLDLDQYESIQALEQHIESRPGITTGEIQDLIRKFGLDGTYDPETHKFRSNRTARFFVTTAVTSSAYLDKDVTSYARKIDKESRDNIEQRIRNAVQSANKDKTGTYTIDTSVLRFFERDLYSVPIFLKASKNAQVHALTLSGHGPVANIPTYQQTVETGQMRYNQEHVQQVQTPSTKMIFNNE